MPKISQVEKVVQSFERDIQKHESEIAMARMTIARLKAEQSAKPARVRKPKPAGAEKL